MIDISVSNLVKEFEVGNKILDGLTFQVDSGQRVGLLGANGTGKTTLLRILMGTLDCDAGEVVIAPGKRMGLISQIPVYPGGFTVEDVLDTAFAPIEAIRREMDALARRMAEGETGGELLRRYDSLAARFEVGGGYDSDTQKNKVANGLSISWEMRGQRFEELSGGEKTRVNLARLILEDTDILLLDEPTNHLDLRATEWLEEYLQKFKGTVLTVSHDRYFLDRVVDRVMELVHGVGEFYSGNYTFYAIEKEQRYETQLKQYEKEQAKIAQLEATARVMHERGTERMHKQAFAMEKRMERIRQTERPTGHARTMKARFGQREFRGDEVLSIKGLSKCFGGRTLFSHVNLEVAGGERIALIGDNGTGKSTLLNILLRELEADEGKIRYGPTVKLGYLPQIVRFDHPERSLVDTLIYDLDCSAQSARNRLGMFQFRGEDVRKPVRALSGGEQSRLRLCMLMSEEINLLILDEPTNHLDIQSREWIEQAVEEYDGNLIFVSHDRYFIERFAGRIWYLEQGVISDFQGTYEQFCAARDKLSSVKQNNLSKIDDQQTKKERPRRAGGTKQLEKEVAAAERAVGKAEEEMKVLSTAIEAAATDFVVLQELYGQQEKLEAELLQCYSHWEALSTQLEETKR